MNKKMISMIYILLDAGVFNAVESELKSLLEEIKTGDTSLSAASYDVLYAYFVTNASSITVNKDVLTAIQSLLDDVWSRSINNPDNAPPSNLPFTPAIMSQLLQPLVSAIQASNKEMVDMLAKLVSAQKETKTSSSKGDQEQLLNGLKQIMESNAEVLKTVAQNNKDSLQEIAASLQGIKDELKDIRGSTGSNQSDHGDFHSDSQNVLDSVNEEDNQADIPIENITSTSSSSKTPPHLTKAPSEHTASSKEYVSKLGFWSGNKAAPMWISKDRTSPFDGLRMDQGDVGYASFAQWSAIMDAFLKAEVVFKDKAHGLSIASPFLTSSVPTLGVVILAWYIIPFMPAFLQLAEKALGSHSQSFTVLFNVNNGKEWKSLNKSLVWNTSSTSGDWVNHWIQGIRALNDQPYNVSDIVQFEIRIYAIRPSPSREIVPLKAANRLHSKVGSLDIEAVPSTNDMLLPYAIGFKLVDLTDPTINKMKTFFLTDFLTTGKDYHEAADKMIRACLTDLANDADGHTIYVHNLGGFDSIYLLKPLAELFGPYKLIMDESNNLITLTIPNSFHLKDSYRIFPASLAELSKMFNVPFPKGELDHSKISIINLGQHREEVLTYLEKDLVSLLDVMIAASSHIFEQYQVDVSTSFSASSLSIKIYRTKFQQVNIPLLSGKMDAKIRESYKGGAVQVFKQEGFNLYYYDVNSLYPYTMTLDMPLHFLDVLKGKEINLSTFTGFIYATVTVPNNCIPVLPHHLQKSDRLSYPQGTFKGLFYAEELRSVRKLGYSVAPHYGYLFSTANLFSDYVNHFYSLKSTVTGGERFIIKLLLNGLYGYFGRRPYSAETVVVNHDQAKALMSTHPVRSVVDLTDEFSLINYESNVDLKSKEQLPAKPALVNVAIASAITAVSRAIMNPFKTDLTNPCFYSDTDSIFVQNPLDPSLIGDKLGQFKDELKGDTITKGLFIKPKCYGYTTKSNLQKVVVAGFPRNELSITDLESLKKGGHISVNQDILVRDFKNQTITKTTFTKDLSLD